MEEIVNKLKIEIFDLTEEAHRKQAELAAIQQQINEKVVAIKQLENLK